MFLINGNSENTSCESEFTPDAHVFSGDTERCAALHFYREKITDFPFELQMPPSPFRSKLKEPSFGGNLAYQETLNRYSCKFPAKTRVVLLPAQHVAKVRK